MALFGWRALVRARRLMLVAFKNGRMPAWAEPYSRRHRQTLLSRAV
jgi:hypothetical protein